MGIVMAFIIAFFPLALLPLMSHESCACFLRAVIFSIRGIFVVSNQSV